VSFSTDYPDPGAILLPNFKTGEGNNKSNYSNKQFDDLVTAASTETDRTKALSAYQQAQQILQDDSPDIFLFYPQANVLRRPTVRELITTAMDFQVLGDRYLEKVKIAK
jgi:oligopeptide transport system substrate-binding protein